MDNSIFNVGYKILQLQRLLEE